MKDKETKDDTYFLGNDQTNSSHRKSLYGKVACIVIIMMLVGAAIGAYLSYRSASSAQRGHQLETIVVLPQGGQMPKFDGDKDFSEFRKWVMQNIQYPQGVEDRPVRVEVNFTVRTDGTLGNFKVVVAPKGTRVYNQAVIELLKKSPRWTPARLSDGTAVDMEFTLPVEFTPEVKGF